MSEPPADTTGHFEQLLVNATSDVFDLKLFVAGMTPRSVEAIRTVRALCEEHLEGRYRLEIIDIYEAPDRARDEQIIAAPTLMRSLPLPIRRLIGDLSDRARILRGLQVFLVDGSNDLDPE